MLVVQLRTHAHYANPLPGVGEYLGGGEQQDVAPSLAGNARGVRLRPGHSVTALTQVHTEIRKILNHNGSAFGCGLRDGPDFSFGKTHPRRVVGAGVHYGCIVPVGKLFFKGRLEAALPQFFRLHAFPGDVEYGHLLLVGGEAGLKHKHLPAPGDALRGGGKGSESPEHRAGGGNMVQRVKVQPEKSFDKARGGLLQYRKPVRGRIFGAHAGIESRFFRLCADAVGSEAGRPQLHMYHRDAGLGLKLGRQLGTVHNAGRAGPLYAEPPADSLHQLFAEHSHNHFSLKRQIYRFFYYRGIIIFASL